MLFKVFNLKVVVMKDVERGDDLMSKSSALLFQLDDANSHVYTSKPLTSLLAIFYMQKGICSVRRGDFQRGYQQRIKCSQKTTQYREGNDFILRQSEIEG